MAIGAIAMWLVSSISAHPTTWALGSAYVAVAMINSLPEPGSGRPAGVLMYQWLFDFLHVLSNRVVQKYPQMSVPAHTLPVTFPQQQVGMKPSTQQPDPPQGQ